jgi:TPR repeat protein
MKPTLKQILAAVCLMCSFGAPVAALTDAEYVANERKMAEAGRPLHQYFLGLAYEQGRGVRQDYAEALKWFRRAADQGLSNAQFQLGLLYYAGRGASQDFVRAYVWFNLATAHGYKMAEPFRDKIERQMTPAQIAEAQTLAHEWSLTKQRLPR